jgi:murein DD-endopeptidase MepM/ murein hydrolase activator NlpD
MRSLLLLAVIAVACAPPARAQPAADAARPGARDGGSPAATTTCGGWKVAEVPVRGSMAAALVPALGEEGSQVAALYARIFMWDLDLRRDIVPGDRMRVVWRSSPAGELEIGAAQYASQRLGKVLRAYRFRGPDDGAPSYWDGPLRDYEQITALLKDRPTHQGMDFKTPVGTAVYAPKSGVVSRIDWKLRGNGHCLEIRFEDGVAAKFLHLSAVKVSRGASVRAGQLVALTGNTGHSTAPHLHYQLNRGQQTLDPIDYHGTSRRRLGGAPLKALEAEIARLEKTCGAGLRSVPPP